LVDRYDIRTAEFRAMRVNKERAVAQVRKYSNGCTRCYLGRIVTYEEFEDNEKEVLSKPADHLGGIFPD
jgi:hypothetical protein